MDILPASPAADPLHDSSSSPILPIPLLPGLIPDAAVPGVATEPARDAAAANASPQRVPRRAAIDLRANLGLLALAGVAALLQLFGLPWLLRGVGPFACLLIVPLLVLTPTHWGLVHEAIHGQLLPMRRANDIVARLYAIALGLPFDAVRFGHLMHHRFTREAYDRPDVHSGPQPYWLARLAYYGRLLGGLYLSELGVPLLAFLPVRIARGMIERSIEVSDARGDVRQAIRHEAASADVQRLFLNFAGDRARRARLRRDWLASIALYGLAFHLYGVWWPVLAATMYGRGVWLSMADNLPHYGVALDEPGRARNFRVARGWPALLMNHHLHRLHHLHPSLPWTALPALLRAADEQQKNIAPLQARPGDAPYFRSALRQFGGPTRAAR